MRPRLDPYPTALAKFRPTPVQSAVRGARVGLLVGACLAVVALAAVGWAGTRTAWAWWAAAVGPVLGGVLAGAVIGLAIGQDVGVNADDIGLHRVPAGRPPFIPWARVADIHAERRGSRTVVAVYLDSGVVSRLPVPYDGRWLARDARFEWKLFTLRNLWETHRSWGAP